MHLLRLEDSGCHHITWVLTWTHIDIEWYILAGLISYLTLHVW
jgi:hypothetical protein